MLFIIFFSQDVTFVLIIVPLYYHHPVCLFICVFTVALHPSENCMKEGRREGRRERRYGNIIVIIIICLLMPSIFFFPLRHSARLAGLGPFLSNFMASNQILQYSIVLPMITMI